jgi:outer membrane lipase/esterase
MGEKVMKQMLRVLALAAAFIAPSAWAQNYSSLIVFGDSLVDPGNAYIGSGFTQASPANGYAAGRFSNGPNFADYLSLDLFGTVTTPALLGGSNIGVGGTTAAHKSAGDNSFLEQIALFPTLSGISHISSSALVLVTFGGNDVRDTIGTSGPVDFSASAAALQTGLLELYNAGARNFVITGTPDIGLLPVSINFPGITPNQLDALTQRSEDINALFSNVTGALDALPGDNATFFDLFGFEHDLLGNPTAFGLPANLNTTTPCQVIGGGVPQIANCANSLYFDAIHPTTQVHAAIADAILRQLGAASVPEPATWMAMILGLAAIGAALRRQRLKFAQAAAT